MPYLFQQTLWSIKIVKSIKMDNRMGDSESFRIKKLEVLVEHEETKERVKKSYREMHSTKMDEM